ncbi:hypothetical protein [Kitasatospora sp. GP82]|uniref:hypothetical protein n=1 Tax=Kitasatospora sp. GP82 TaxID=3035089 RepID=UPI0024772151|nr:hypothetical protein [Kitasatospora sp. GP82]MDH6125569.1 hypothetical protein [Kitasatospora sp. GP82]
MTRPPHPLAFLRALSGDTQVSYARLVAATHEDLGFGKLCARREKVSRWETQDTPPDRSTQLAIAHIHRVPEEEVQRLAWPHWLHLGTAASSRAGRSRPRDVTPGAVPAWDLPALHPARSRLALGGAALASFTRQTLAALADPPLLPARDGNRIAPDTVALIEARVNALTEMVPVVNPVDLLRVARAEFGLATALLTGDEYEQPAGARLFCATSQIADLCGTLSGALGEEARAERYRLAAVRAAALAGSRLLASVCLADLAVNHVKAGDPADAFLLTGAARTATPASPPRLRALLHAREARAHARLGEVIAGARALDRAADALTAVEAADEDAPMCRNVDEEWLSRVAGKAWLDAGQPGRALKHFAALLDDGPRSWTETQPPVLTANSLLDAVDAQLALGEVEAAIHSTRRATALFDRMPAGLVRQYRQRFVAHAGIAAVRSLLDLLTETPSA